jgi:hypothetical protein
MLTVTGQWIKLLDLQFKIFYRKFFSLLLPPDTAPSPGRGNIAFTADYSFTGRNSSISARYCKISF